MKTIPKPAPSVNLKNKPAAGNATILDVARRAGVAPITVSRVINQSGYASPATRARVEAAVAALGYVPNTLARSLRSRRTHTLALVLTDITNPFFTLAARGVEDTAAEAGFTLIVCNTDESEEKERRYVQMLLEKQVDGIILVPARGRIQSVRLVEAQHTPLVLLDRRLPGHRVDTVRCDSVGGAYQLTRHLLAGGHRHIAMLSGPKGVSTADDRIKGYCRALSESGMKGGELIRRGNFTCESGAEMTRELLSLEPRPTAIFAANNFLAIGTLRTLHEAGIPVPGQVSVVAFDDLPANLLVEPFLSAASQPAYEMGQTAARLLLDRVLQQSPSPPREIIVPPQIIVRQSSTFLKHPVSS
jgi:LacI family transcriptional regulator